MARYNIPSIADQIRLTRAWEFPLHFEYRNEGLMSRIRPGLTISWHDKGSIIATLEKGTILKVARIYIRQGKSEWDSVTFTVVEAPKDGKRAKKSKRKDRWNRESGDSGPQPEEKYKGARFWAKLDDVNNIYFEPVEE